MVYDISLPASLKRSVEREALFGELAARMPVPSESVCWFYRVCGGGRFRVYAVHREEMARLLEFARSHSLKFDLAIPAALAETPEEILQVVLGEAPPEEFRPIRCRGLKNLSLELFACKCPASQITQESCSGIPCFLGDLRNTRDFTVSLVVHADRNQLIVIPCCKKKTISILPVCSTP